MNVAFGNVSTRRWKRGILQPYKTRLKWRPGVLLPWANVENAILLQARFLNRICGSLVAARVMKESLRMLRGCYEVPCRHDHRHLILALLSLGIAFVSDSKEARRWRKIVRGASDDNAAVLRGEFLWLNVIG